MGTWRRRTRCSGEGGFRLLGQTCIAVHSVPNAYRQPSGGCLQHSRASTHPTTRFLLLHHPTTRLLLLLPPPAGTPSSPPGSSWSRQTSTSPDCDCLLATAIASFCSLLLLLVTGRVVFVLCSACNCAPAADERPAARTIRPGLHLLSGGKSECLQSQAHSNVGGTEERKKQDRYRGKQVTSAQPYSSKATQRGGIEWAQQIRNKTTC